MLTAQEIADHIGWETNTWEGNCYGIVLEILRAGIVAGEPRYGSYLGPVSDTCSTRGFVQQNRSLGSVRHGWIEQKDGTIIDPTRWCFMGWETAHVFTIPPDDERQEEYDIAGQGMSRMMHANREIPTRKTGDRKSHRIPIDLGLSAECMNHLHGLLSDTSTEPLTWAQWYWVGNAPIDVLEPFAREVYEGMKADENHLGAAIPRDHYDHVMGLWAEDI